ncbi:MAG: hypothetical protein HY870_16695 [Chloroflexi bacterium]|nr:hypothetical protein [Chloroflexota bacterium]
MINQTCPDCGATLSNGATCQDHFYQMLYWEVEDPARGEVHHLMVLCYHLQHPSLYSPDGLRHALGLLEDFVVRGKSPAEVRQRQRDTVASDQRAWKVTARPGAHGAYERPIVWTLTAADVIAGGADAYCDNVRLWARSVYEAAKP